MNRDRSKSSKPNRARQHDPNASTRRSYHRSRRNLFDNWAQGPSTRTESNASIRSAADLLGSCSSGWISVYLRCVANGTITLYRSETEPLRNEMRHHKPRHWICNAWKRMCTNASVVRSINPAHWAIIDVLFVAFLLWLVINVCKK